VDARGEGGPHSRTDDCRRPIDDRARGSSGGTYLPPELPLNQENGVGSSGEKAISAIALERPADVKAVP